MQHRESEQVCVMRLDVASRRKWDDFVERCSEATFFHRADWKTVIETVFKHDTYFLYAQRYGQIEGVLPLTHIKSIFFGNSLVSSPFCVYGGVAASSEEAREALIEEAKRLAHSLEVKHLECRNQVQRESDWSGKDLYVTFKKELDPDIDLIMKAIPRKQRAMVRKGINNGLVGEYDDTIERFYDAYSQSVHSLGTPVFAKSYFKILKEVFSNDCDVLTITKDKQLVSSVFSFYFRDEVLPYYGGGTEIARTLKGNDFMYWELMRRSCEKGIRIFDYGRSKKGTGSYSFKKNWGFEPQALHYEYYLVTATEVPNINPLNPKYEMFIKAWKKMPLGLTKLIGPHIVKQLG